MRPQLYFRSIKSTLRLAAKSEGPGIERDPPEAPYTVSSSTVSAQLGCGPCAGGGLSSLGCVPSDRGVARVFLSALRRRALIEALPMVAVLDHLHRVIFGSVYEQCPDQSAYCGYPKYFVRGMRYSHCSESGNDSLDSVGGIGPTVLERACDSVESDRVRSNEFVHWRDPINTRVWPATVLDTGPSETSTTIIGCDDVESGIRWIDPRRERGFESADAISN